MFFNLIKNYVVFSWSWIAIQRFELKFISHSQKMLPLYIKSEFQDCKENNFRVRKLTIFDFKSVEVEWNSALYKSVYEFRKT